MRILFTRFPLESAYGGAEWQTLSLMKGLLARGHAVAFLGSCPILLELCRNENIPFAELKIGSPPVTKSGAITFAWRKRKMKKLLATALAQFQDLDAIFMLSLSEKLLLTEPAVTKGMNVLWVEHDRIGRWLSGNPWLKPLLKAAQSATTIAVSKMTKDAYIALGWPAQKVVDIVNGVDTARLGSGTHAASHSRLRLGCVARLSADKGVDVLLKALEDLPEIDLAIVGKGKDERTIRTFAQKLNAQAGRERITMQPSAPSIGDFYRSIDAFVLPSSQQDPCPLAPMEALMVGTPVILTDACGTAGYVTDEKEALVVPANSASALKQAIMKMTDPAFRKKLAEAGMAAAQAKFSLDRMIDEYEGLLHTPAQ